MSVKYYSKFTYLHSRKCIWKCRLRNIGNLVSASMSRHKFAMVMIPNKVLKLGIIISLWIVTVFEIPVKIQSDWWTQLPVTIFCISVNLDLLTYMNQWVKLIADLPGEPVHRSLVDVSQICRPGGAIVRRSVYRRHTGHGQQTSSRWRHCRLRTRGRLCRLGGKCSLWLGHPIYSES